MVADFSNVSHVFFSAKRTFKIMLWLIAIPASGSVSRLSFVGTRIVSYSSLQLVFYS